ncbi:MAG: BatA domain-containing protein [Kofleriaceae bacterium]
MGFLTPLMLLGLVAIAVPIGIHLIGRRRAKVVRFAALEFLLASKRRTARRFALRERLLLAVRVLLCAVIPLAIAKPFASCQRRGPAVLRGPQAAVLVIDDSFASAYDQRGPWLRRAVEEAHRILRQLGPEAEVAILRASEGADHSGELTRDHLRLHDQLKAIAPRARPADTTRALRRAAQLLGASNHERKTVFLLSLLAATGLANAEAAWDEHGPAMQVVELRPDGELANRAITKLTIDPDPSTGPRGVAITVEVGNFSATPLEGLEISIALDGAVIARGAVDVPAKERRTKRFLAALPPGERVASVTASLRRDALAVDDVRYAQAYVRDDLRVLLVNGDPRTTRHDDELFYLEAALRPGDRADSGNTVRTVTSDELAGVSLADYDVVVLANVPALGEKIVAELAQWIRQGGGLLVAPGERVDADAYDRTMLPLLPQGLRDPIDTTWGATAAEKASRALHLVKWEADHPIFAPFSKDAPELAEASFFKISLLGPTTDTADRKVLARFTNGAAALVEAAQGAGRILLYTSTLDREWNDLPIHAGFLPMMQQAVRHLARQHLHGGQREHLIGESVALPTADLRKLEVRGPTGSVAYEGDRLAGKSQVRFARTDDPGTYLVFGTDATGATGARSELTFAVNVDPKGSDLAPAAASALPRSGDASDGPSDQPTERRVELWHAVAGLLLLLLLLEGLLVR